MTRANLAPLPTQVRVHSAALPAIMCLAPHIVSLITPVSFCSLPVWLRPIQVVNTRVVAIKGSLRVKRVMHFLPGNQPIVPILPVYSVPPGVCASVLAGHYADASPNVVRWVTAAPVAAELPSNRRSYSLERL